MRTIREEIMRIRSLASIGLFFAIVLFSCVAAKAQVVEVVKDAASKTKDISKKTAEVVADTAKDVADTTGDVTVAAAKKTVSTSKKIGNYSVNVTENVAGAAYEGGKYFTVKTWDGTKWVSKRVWFATKKAADATKDFVVGDGEKKP